MSRAEFLQRVDDVPEAEWDGLFRARNPFLRHRFLATLERSGVVGGDSGWEPMHLLLREGERLRAAMPLYRKQHSWGEFVFDWAWAEAYQRHGLDYYPKLVTAAPFTPSTGPRVGLAPGVDEAEVLSEVLRAVQSAVREQGLSGWHLLFPDGARSEALRRLAPAFGLHRRHDVQFHWRNAGYASFDDYLASLRSSRRKNLRRERRRVAEQGVVLERLPGERADGQARDDFYRCYVTTYLRRSGHAGYLNRDFFERLFASQGDQVMLVMARRRGDCVASALFLHDEEVLYGRYWGALEAVDCLHFEACFYQGIEFCIERGLQRFDPGTQGEHKLLRGFEPVTTTSFHWLADARFNQAIGDWLEHERRATGRFSERAAELLPFRRPA